MFPVRHSSVLFAISAIATLLLCAPSAWAAPKYKVLHAFTGGKDGGGLWGSLVLDHQGNVYGTTVAGGPNGGGGTVFKLTPRANETWAETVLYGFCALSDCTDGGGSTAGLIFDSAGNLYGTTRLGGSSGFGTVFELTPQREGALGRNGPLQFPSSRRWVLPIRQRGHG
jgi:uncharacterized repeat protein (TIGR03803 family)